MGSFLVTAKFRLGLAWLMGIVSPWILSHLSNIKIVIKLLIIHLLSRCKFSFQAIMKKKILLKNLYFVKEETGTFELQHLSGVFYWSNQYSLIKKRSLIIRFILYRVRHKFSDTKNELFMVNWLISIFLWKCQIKKKYHPHIIWKF